MKSKKMTMVDMIDNLFRRLAGKISELKVMEEAENPDQYKEQCLDRKSNAGLLLEILDQIYDSGIAFTKEQVKMIVDAKKKIYPTIYVNHEPVAGSSI